MKSPQAHICEPHDAVFDAALDGWLRNAPTSPKWLDKEISADLQAQLTAILGNELNFHRHLAFLNREGPNRQSPHSDCLANTIPALRHASLQGDGFILAPCALGLDCEPMGGFDHATIEAEVFAGSAIRSNFSRNLGYAVQAGTLARNQCLGFDEACQIL
jgi:3-hydroxypropanoate dehydrogenase